MKIFLKKRRLKERSFVNTRALWTMKVIKYLHFQFKVEVLL